MAFGSGWLNNVQGTYAQLNPFDNGRTYDTNRRGVDPYQAPAAAAPPKPVVKPPTNLKPATVDNGSFMAGLNAQIAALQNQLSYTPKLPSFDIVGNYNKARSTAEAAVNPLYDKYMKEFLATQEQQKAAKQNEVNLSKQSAAQELQNTLEGNQVTRTRTSEDVANGIADLNNKEGQFQQDSGTQFDTDRRALAEDTAAAGLTTSGIGQGKIYDQNNKRNLDESQQVQEYTNQRAAKKLFETRTFEDMARGDTQAQQVADNKQKGADFDLESYLADLAGEQQKFTNSNEAARINDIAGQTGTYEQQGTQSFLQSLAGAGWRPQDIAMAYQIYG